MIGKDDKLCSVVVIPGGPKTTAFSGRYLAVQLSWENIKLVFDSNKILESVITFS